MDRKKKSTLLYRLLFSFARLNFRLFYREIHVEGIKNIPLDKPVIFAANHQNALMDALTMLFSTNKAILFLSRADIFKNKHVAKLLTFMQIMPVYRPRDGVETLHLNTKVFEMAANYLQSGIPLGIFPEGSHQEKKRLFPLKKGICRIAFETAKMTNFNLNLVVIPIGIDYSNFQDRGSDLVVNIGQPIEVKDYYELYKENPNKAITRLSERISRSLKPLMIHVENLEEYASIIELSNKIISIENDNTKSKEQAITAYHQKKKIIQHIDELSINNLEEYEKLKNTNLSSNKNSSSHRHQPNNLISSIPLMALMLISSIISIPGIILNFAPYLLVLNQVKKVRDSQFKSSYDYVLSLLVYPLWYLILFIIFWIIINFQWALLIVTTAIVTGILTLRIIYYLINMVRMK